MRMNWGGKLLGGVAAGAAATITMTAVMVAGQRMGLLGKLPPRKITDGIVRRVVGRRPRSQTSRALTGVTHLGFGAAAGAGYGALVQRRRPAPEAVARGMLYGSLVWLVSYGGWVPALGIMPAPPRDWPGRQITMLAAHLVYGATLGALVGRA